MTFLKFAMMGAVLLAEDLYQYSEERTLDRIPSFDTDRNQTRETPKESPDYID